VPRPYNLILGEGTTKGERGLGDDVYPTDQQLGATPSATEYNLPGSAGAVINAYGGMTSSQSSLLLWVGVGLLALVVLPHIGSR
jgi:hypothetical protein